MANNKRFENSNLIIDHEQKIIEHRTANTCQPVIIKFFYNRSKKCLKQVTFQQDYAFYLL